MGRMGENEFTDIQAAIYEMNDNLVTKLDKIVSLLKDIKKALKDE